MNIEQMHLILDKIKQYDKIAIFRHIRPDGDAVGATLGLRDMLRLTYPEKEVLSLNCDFGEYVAFMGEEDAPRSDEFFADALGVVLDTANVERISNPQYALCRELIKIDHHINVQPYGDVMWVEEGRSSACEMVAELYYANREELRLNAAVATELYAGMVTDSGRFRFNSVSGDTLRYAGMLLDIGIDTDTLYAHLYLRDVKEYRFQSYVYKKMKITSNGVAWLYIDRAVRRRFGLTSEQAGEAVNQLSAIRDSLIWLVVLEADDGSIRVRLRSRFVPIHALAEQFGGGGHAHACGATVHSKKEAKQLIARADECLAQYKVEHHGWL